MYAVLRHSVSVWWNRAKQISCPIKTCDSTAETRNMDDGRRHATRRHWQQFDHFLVRIFISRCYLFRFMVHCSLFIVHGWTWTGCVVNGDEMLTCKMNRLSEYLVLGSTATTRMWRVMDDSQISERWQLQPLQDIFRDIRHAYQLDLEQNGASQACLY